MPELSSLERTFQTYWGMLSTEQYADPVTEFRFAPPRKFRFDLAWPDLKIAVELEGGVYSGGRHTRGKGFENDCEKYNLAALNNWLVVRYTSNMLKNDPISVIRQIQHLIDIRSKR
jgi:very-short-patch-repair endonuclease